MPDEQGSRGGRGQLSWPRQRGEHLGGGWQGLDRLAAVLGPAGEEQQQGCTGVRREEEEEKRWIVGRKGGVGDIWVGVRMRGV